MLSWVSIQSKLLLMLLLTSVLSAAIVGAIGYQSGRASLRAAAFDRLTEIREAQTRYAEGSFKDLQNSLLVYTRGSTTINAMRDFTKGFKRIDGLFRMYLDMEKGAPWLYIAKSQLGPEFIYFNHSVDGPVGVGHNRGRYGEETIVVLRKIFDKVEFVESNTSIYFDPQSPLASADLRLLLARRDGHLLVASHSGPVAELDGELRTLGRWPREADTPVDVVLF